MEELLKRHIKESDKKFDGVSKNFARVFVKLDDLQTFKVKMMVSSKWISVLISGVCGIIAISLSLLITWIGARHG